MNQDIIIHIDQFDGPLALLLYLVQKEEMDIQDLDLTTITGQYLNYINKMEELNFDVAGEYLYMASLLIFFKSEKSVNESEKSNEDQEENEFEIYSKEQLILRLQELEKYQKLGNGIWQLPKEGEAFYKKPKVNKKFHFQSFMQEMEMSDLTSVMIDYLKKQRRRVHVVAKEKLSIKNKLIYLKKLLVKGKKFLFKDLLESANEKTQEIVMTFISILELARLQKLEVFQAENSEEIHVDVIGSLKDFDVNQADGFEDGYEDQEDDSAEDLPPVPELIQGAEVVAPTETLQ